MTIFADRYEIRGDLGSGGYGQVHRAFDRNLGREVALKLLAPGEDVLAIREAHALTHLESPHVLRVLNAGAHQDVPFLTTAVADLRSTEDHLLEGIGVRVDHAVRWVRHALVGLDYCHRSGILHRDLKPSNVFLNTLDHAMLGDFGVAVNIEGDGTAPTGGNQRVRAPEGFETGRLTSRSEVFSAGVTLWRLLTGEWPYDGATEAELYDRMRSGPPSIRDVAPHVPRSVAHAVQAALAPNPSDRPARPAEFGEVLAGCRLSTRDWRGVAPQTGEERRWIGDTPSGPIAVSLVGSRARLEVIAVRINSGRRIQEGCFSVTRSQAPRRLRQLFDRI